MILIKCIFLHYSSFKPGDCFVGYHSDTAAAVIIKISNAENRLGNDQV